MDILNRVLLTFISVISCLDSFWRPLSVLILKEIITKTMSQDITFHFLDWVIGSLRMEPGA